MGPLVYTEYVCWDLTAGIPVKFVTTHGRSSPEVGSTKHSDAYGRKGITRGPRIIGTSDRKIMIPTVFFLFYQSTTFASLLFVDWTNIYQTAAKRKLSSNRLQCRTLLPICVRRDCCTMKIWQTHLLSICSGGLIAP